MSSNKHKNYSLMCFALLIHNYYYQNSYDDNYYQNSYDDKNVSIY